MSSRGAMMTRWIARLTLLNIRYVLWSFEHRGTTARVLRIVAVDHADRFDAAGKRQLDGRRRPFAYPPLTLSP
jgi:hypothetical protein